MIIAEHIPGLIVIISLILSSFICINRNTKINRAIYYLLAVFSFTCSVLLLIHIDSNNVNVFYSFGSWKNGIGIDFSVNRISGLMLLICSSVFLITSPSVLSDKHTKLYGFCGLVFTGLCGLIMTADIFNLYVFMELVSIAIYVIFTSDNGKFTSYSYAFDYLITGSIANIFILIGIFLIYTVTGHLNMMKISYSISAITSKNALIAVNSGYIFIIIGLLAKSAIYPIHNWIMHCYLNSSSKIISFIVGMVTKVAIFNIYKINSMFGEAYLSTNLFVFTKMLNIFCYAGIIFCSFSAMLGTELKKIIVFSSIAQSSYLVLGIFSSNHGIINGVLFQMITHSISASALFMLIGEIEKNGTIIMAKDIKKYLENSFLYKIILVLCFFSIAGFPMTIGFVGKWYMISGFYEINQYPAMICVIIGSTIGITYSWKVLEYVFFGDNTTNDCFKNDATKSNCIKLSFLLCILALIVPGLFASKIINITKDAASVVYFKN